MLALSLDGKSALDLFRSGSHPYYAIGAAAVLAVVITFGTSRDPPAPTSAFADRWSAVPLRVAQLPTKQVRTVAFVPTVPANPALPEIDGFLQLPMPPPKPEEKPPENLPPPRIKMADNPPPRIVARADLKGPDICRGKGRVITRGGKSWRCRR